MKSKGAGGLPFASSVGDSFELMKRMWGMAGLPSVPGPGDLASMAVRLPSQLPSMVAPTLDVEELDKRITDLRAVEQWLELNAGLLRTTIQTLEVQRATISTLKSFSGAMLAPMMMGKGAPAMPAATQPTPMPSWAMPPATQAVSPPPVAPPSEPPPEPRAPRKRRKPAATLRTTGGEPALNPTAWWNTLQDQFSKIAAAAVAPPPPVEAKVKPAKPAARKRAAKKRRR